MASKFTLSNRRDRARSAMAAAAVHLVLGTAFFAGLALHAERRPDDSLKTFDVVPPVPPPPAPPQRSPTPREKPAPAGKKADPSPIVAPPARLPTPQPVVAAMVAGAGSAPTAGAAADGRGTGAGGIGDGRGGGNGAGRSGARLISGALGGRDYRRIDDIGSSRGTAELLLLINPAGRIERCRTLRTSGNPAVDELLCSTMIDRARFDPAREASGEPLFQEIRYFPTWRR